MSINFLRGKAARTAAGYPASSTFHLKKKTGLLPPPVMFGPKTACYPEHELDAINAARLAGKSDDDVRALVQQLVAARSQATESAYPKV